MFRFYSTAQQNKLFQLKTKPLVLGFLSIHCRVYTVDSMVLHKPAVWFHKLNPVVDQERWRLFTVGSLFIRKNGFCGQVRRFAGDRKRLGIWWNRLRFDRELNGRVLAWAVANGSLSLTPKITVLCLDPPFFEKSRSCLRLYLSHLNCPDYIPLSACWPAPDACLNADLGCCSIRSFVWCTSRRRERCCSREFVFFAPAASWIVDPKAAARWTAWIHRALGLRSGWPVERIWFLRKEIFGALELFINSV